MLQFWLADENLFFAGAGCLLLALMVLHFVGFGDFGPDIDVDMDITDVSISDGLLSFLGLGRLPMMIWLALYLMLFTILGYAGQQIIEALTGGLLPSIVAAPAAGLASLPLTALLARPLERIMPKDETTAVSIDSLVGRFAEIEIGTATQGSSARAKVTDIYGHNHFVMVEPDNVGQSFVKGEKLLLVRREGDLFKAISQGAQHLPRLDS